MRIPSHHQALTEAQAAVWRLSAVSRQVVKAIRIASAGQGLFQNSEGVLWTVVRLFVTGCLRPKAVLKRY